MKQAFEDAEGRWSDVCAVAEILPDTGVCCAVAGEQVAVFRYGEGEELYALSNFDPFSRANVISRGIVGDRAGEPKVASPVFKQAFSLKTGLCLDDPSVRLATYEVSVKSGLVRVRPRRAEA
jgi:nitrite reductase (NADH) small subunit